jgi:hypothetical protein
MQFKAGKVQKPSNNSKKMPLKQTHKEKENETVRNHLPEDNRREHRRTNRELDSLFKQAENQRQRTNLTRAHENDGLWYLEYFQQLTENKKS